MYFTPTALQINNIQSFCYIYFFVVHFRLYSTSHKRSIFFSRESDSTTPIVQQRCGYIKTWVRLYSKWCGYITHGAVIFKMVWLSSAKPPISVHPYLPSPPTSTPFLDHSYHHYYRHSHHHHMLSNHLAEQPSWFVTIVLSDHHAEQPLC